MLRQLAALFLLLAALLPMPVSSQILDGFGALEGVVRDSRSRVLPNATVRLTVGPTPLIARTDKDGKYRFAEAGAGRYEVICQKPGYNSVAVSGLAIGANQTVRRDFRLEWSDSRSGGIEFSVVDRDGAPLGEATVQLLLSSTPISAGTTDSAGITTFTGLPQQVYSAEIRRAGYDPVSIRNIRVEVGRLTAAKATLSLNLRDVGRIMGQVRDVFGSALAAARVRIVSGPTRREVASNADGRYELSGLIPSEAYSLEVSASGFNTVSRTGVRVRAQQATVIDFPLVAIVVGKGAMSGSIRNADGLPITGATVDLVVGPGSGRQAISGPDGLFVFPELQPFSGYSITVRAAGFVPVGQSNIAVENGRSTVVDITLANEVILPGRISGGIRDDANGAPLGEVLVEVLRGPSLGVNTLSQVSGAYVLEGLAPSEGYTIRFTRAGYEPLSLAPVRVRPGQVTALDVRMRPLRVSTGSISGLVKGAGTSAIAGASVTIFLGAPSPIRVNTNSAGRFTITGLPAGEYALRVEAAGFIPLERRGVRVNAGANTVQEFNLGRVTANGALAGKVSDLGLRPIRGASVRIVAGPTVPAEPRLTNERGEFRFESLQSGVYSVQVTASGFVTQTKTGISVGPGGTANLSVVMLR